MAPQKAPLHSMVHWVNYVQMIAHNLPQKSFSAVENPLEFHFGMKDMDSLNSDQRLLYEYTVGISRGKVDPRFALWKIGPLNRQGG